MESEQRLPQSLMVSGFGCIRNSRVLLRNIDLKVSAGQLLFLKGNNGAGKSTLLRSLAGLLPWRAGQLTWCGQAMEARSPDYQQHLAYLGHQSGMSDALTGIENLRFALHMLDVAWLPASVATVLGQLDVAAVATRPFGRLSQGQRRRLAIARVILSERPLWLLDEPDNALDRHGGAFLEEALKKHTENGGMAVVVTHRGLSVSETPSWVLDLSASTLQIPTQDIAC